MGLLTWLIIGALVTTATVITLSVVITVAVIRDLMRNNADGFEDAFSVHVKQKLNDGNHTVIKVKINKNDGTSTEREIRSDKGSSGIYEGQTIY